MRIVKLTLLVLGTATGLLAAAQAPSAAQGLGPYGPPAYGQWGGAPYHYYSGRGYPAGYDTGGAPYYLDELGAQPGPRTGAPANPCYSGLRAQNRC